MAVCSVPDRHPWLTPSQGIAQGKWGRGWADCLSLLLHFLIFLLLDCGLDAASDEVQIPLSVGGDSAALAGGTGGHNINVRQLRP